MKRPNFMFWNGGQPFNFPEAKAFAKAQPRLPAPALLHEAAIIEYWWGATRFEIAAASCSLRDLFWGEEKITWLHCKAAPAIKEGERTQLFTVLIPVRYVTAMKAAGTVRFGSATHRERDVCVFAPIQGIPQGALPLAEIQAVLARLLACRRS